MSKLTWHNSGDNRYETGVGSCSLYLRNLSKTVAVNGTVYDNGVAWNGITSISEKPEGAEVTGIYADNIKYLNLVSRENFKASVEAYTYPDAFAECDGSYIVMNNGTSTGMNVHQQTRKNFGLVFKSNVGTDEKDANDPTADYILHILYNCRAGVSERQYQSINDSPEAMTFSWDLETTDDDAIKSANSSLKACAHLQIRTENVPAANKKYLDRLEAILYGCSNAFSSSKAYSVNDIVTYQAAPSQQVPVPPTELFVCTTNHSAGAWNASHFTKINGSANATLIPANYVYSIMSTGFLPGNSNVENVKKEIKTKSNKE